MDPSLQHHYLQTLGIVQYVPRDTVYKDIEAPGDIEAKPENAATRPEPPTGKPANRWMWLHWSIWIWMLSRPLRYPRQLL